MLAAGTKKGTMKDNTERGVVPKVGLSPKELVQVTTLAATCNALEGLDLKLTFPSGPDEKINAWLVYQQGALAGYCALDGTELCGMVHPTLRRQGIGRKLLQAAKDELARRGKSDCLLICEEASRSGQHFVSSLGATHQFSEHRMALVRLPRRPPPIPGLTLRAVAPAESERLIQVLTFSFGDPEHEVRSRTAESLTQENERFYLAWLDDVPVGCLNEITEGDWAGIYAFGVLPAYRRQGIGRQMLYETARRLLDEGYTPITLEVETDNAPAIALYGSCGFQQTTTYGYYRVEVGGAVFL